MKNMFNYKGYLGQVKIDEKSKMICGEVIGIQDVISFQGKTVEDAIQDFHDCIDEYLEYCEEIGKKPDKSFSGRLPYRTAPDTHRKIFEAASLAGKSINSWMDEVLSDAADKVIYAKM